MSRLLTIMFAWVALMLLQPGPVLGAAVNWELDQLMARMATQAMPRVTYREEKRFAFLEQELVSTGALKYQEPDILIREVTSPDREVYTARGSLMIIQKEGKPKLEVNLEDHPVAFIFMKTFKAILKGNLESLQKYYRIKLKGKKSFWSLRLIPLDENVLKYVDSIIITGRDGIVKSIETKEVGGDSTLMVFDKYVD